MKNFVIFIISHNNCEDIKTEKALNDSGYTGKYFIIIDDKDSKLNEYKKIYKDKLIIFSKEKIKNKIDLMDNFNIYASPVYVRNFCYQYAKEINCNYFGILDDDIFDFLYVYPEDNKLKRLKIKNINKVFESIVKFLETNEKLSIVAFSQDGGNFGGLNGRYSKGFNRTVSQCMICKTRDDVDFCGTMNEDLNISLKNFDKIFIEIFSLAVKSPQRGNNSSMYKSTSMYTNNFYSVMICPSGIKIKCTDKSYTLKRYYNKIFPKIVSKNL